MSEIEETRRVLETHKFYRANNEEYYLKSLVDPILSSLEACEEQIGLDVIALEKEKGENLGLRHMVSEYQTSCKIWEEIVEKEKDRMKELDVELKEGDYWIQRAKDFLSNGGCPVCFTTDETGHIKGCLWEQTESSLKELEAVVKSLIDFIPKGWEMPLGYTQIVIQAEKVLEKVRGN